MNIKYAVSVLSLVTGIFTFSIPITSAARCINKDATNCDYSIFEGSANFPEPQPGGTFTSAIFKNILKALDTDFGQLYWESHGTNDIKLRSDNLIGNVLINNTGSKVGIGGTTTTPITPIAKLHITGDGTLETSFALEIQNSASANLLIVRDDGNVGIGTESPSKNLVVGDDDHNVLDPDHGWKLHYLYNKGILDY